MAGRLRSLSLAAGKKLSVQQRRQRSTLSAVTDTADAVVLGAGIVGLAAAYHLAKNHGLRKVVVADPRPPLSVTSSKSTEAYRNFFDTAPMVAFMNRSISGMEDHAAACDNAFRMNRRGYAFVSEHGSSTAQLYEAAAQAASTWGAGQLRVHRSGADHYVPFDSHREKDLAAFVAGKAWTPETSTGFDLLLGRDLIQKHFPFVSPKASVLLHARRCGWLNAHLYGMHFLEQAREHGVRVIPAGLTGVELDGDQILAVSLHGSDEEQRRWRLATRVVVNATGPYLQATQRTLDPRNPERASLHVRNEVHGKVVLRIPAFIRTTSTETIPSPARFTADSVANLLAEKAPMMIWSDEVELPFTPEERAAIQAEELQEHTTLMARALGRLPGGIHFRPYGVDSLLALWEFVHVGRAVSDPPAEDLSGIWDPAYAEIVQRGLAEMVPALRECIGRVRATAVDGGYYCRAKDDWPLIGPHGPQGVFVCGGLRGVGIMGAEAAGDLLARHVVGATLPTAYAEAFHPGRLSRRSSETHSGLSYHAVSGQL